MNASRGAVWGVTTVVLLTGLLVGPAVPGPDVTEEPRTFGEGDGSVADVELLEAPAIDHGRFGTRVHYLRGPATGVTVRDVRGTPRLILRVRAPALDYDETATVLLRAGERGSRELAIADSILDEDALPEDPITVRTSVRVQSFSGDRTVYDANHTIGGGG